MIDTALRWFFTEHLGTLTPCAILGYIVLGSFLGQLKPFRHFWFKAQERELSKDRE